MSKNVLKSITAVIVGFLAVAVLSTITDVVLENIGVFPSFDYQMKYGSPNWLLATALVYRSIYAVIGGYVTAVLAPNHPMRHVIILAVLGTILGMLGTIANWYKTTPGTEWYPISLIPVSFFFVWLGGKLPKTRKGK